MSDRKLTLYGWQRAGCTPLLLQTHCPLTSTQRSALRCWLVLDGSGLPYPLAFSWVIQRGSSEAPLGEWRGAESQVNFLLPLGCVPLLEAAAPFQRPSSRCCHSCKPLHVRLRAPASPHQAGGRNACFCTCDGFPKPFPPFLQEIRPCFSLLAH